MDAITRNNGYSVTTCGMVRDFQQQTTMPQRLSLLEYGGGGGVRVCFLTFCNHCNVRLPISRYYE